MVMGVEMDVVMDGVMYTETAMVRDVVKDEGMDEEKGGATGEENVLEN
jgi:hypothetical protein